MYVSVEKQCMDTLLVNAKRNAFLKKKKRFCIVTAGKPLVLGSYWNIFCFYKDEVRL